MDLNHRQNEINTMSEQLIGASFDSIVEKHFSSAEQQTPEMRLKLPIVRKLFVRGVIDWPSQAYVQDALDIALSDLHELLHFGHSARVEIIELVECPMERNCHLSTAYHWLLNPTLQIWSGYADQTHYHSWLYSPESNTVYEPTPIKRDYYYGHRVSNEREFFFLLLPSIQSRFELSDDRPTSWSKFVEKTQRFVDQNK